MGLSITDDQHWKFFKKGKANALYRYVGDDAHFSGKLLRLRLADQTIRTTEVFEFIEKQVRPRLPEVIACELVEVGFRKQELLNDGFALLIPSLVPEGAVIEKADNYFNTFRANGQFILELKPKWLSDDILKCRNCAHHNYKHGRNPDFCSLDLLEKDTLPSALELITEDSQIHTALYQYFLKDDNVLRKLTDLQKTEISIAEITDKQQVSDELCSIMTLRDVTVFITVIADNVVQVTVTDTDPKHKSKWKHWVSTEKKLQENGYYDTVTKHH